MDLRLVAIAADVAGYSAGGKKGPGLSGAIKGARPVQGGG
jgi:hypothetical protein